MYRFSDAEFGDVSANAFNSMLGGVDLNSDAQAELAQEVIQAMLLGPPTTTPAIPTRTPDPDAKTTTTEATTTDVQGKFLSKVKLSFVISTLFEFPAKK